GFFRNKTKAVQGACRALVLGHGGEVPADMDALVKLPGVGRKTANVVLGVWYKRPAIIVDTHLSRVTQRLGLTHETDPDKIETELRRIVPEARWTEFSHGIGFHGRRVCKARKPECEACRISRWCDYFAALRKETAARGKRQDRPTAKR
ncbi:MAG: endonuclease III, partial [Planctomycetota bacterium]